MNPGLGLELVEAKSEVPTFGRETISSLKLRRVGGFQSLDAVAFGRSLWYRLLGGATSED